MFFRFWTLVLIGAFLGSSSALAHIELLSPLPLLNSREGNESALKSPPFGAPNVDPELAPATTVKSGSILDIEVEVYVYHPGDIVVLFTTDPEGTDIEPAWKIPKMGARIPHTNLLHKGKTPDRDESNIYRASVQLPNIEGVIYLVVRQVMHDKFDANPDGTVSLARVYYHQATKLNLVK
ncbi:MAG: hypothetical protein V3R64_06210 [Sphingomonadales bacterium]